MTSTYLSTITNVDLGATPKCEGCGDTAELVLHARCCAACGLACRECRDELRTGVDRKLLAGIELECAFCAADVTGWSQYVREVSL